MALLALLQWASKAMLLVALLVAVFTFASVKDSTAETYLTKDQALNLLLGENTEHIYDPKEIPESLSTKTSKAHFFLAKVGDEITGYALIDSEVGKHLPITYIVGISPNGKVTKVEIMIYREVRGFEVREKRFTKQFEGKTKNDVIEIGNGIRNVSGATISSRSIAKGTNRALLLWNYFYGPKQKTEE